MRTQRKIVPVVAKYKLGEQPKDVVYWLSQPPEARWGATEEIRREYHGWQEGNEPRGTTSDLGKGASTTPVTPPRTSI